MNVTFRADGRVLHYSPGTVYTEALTPLLEALLRNGSNLVLIDPLTLDPVPAPAPVPVLVQVPKPEPKAEEKKHSPPAAAVVVVKDTEESDEDKE
jgi:hypothetical protein